MVHQSPLDLQSVLKGQQSNSLNLPTIQPLMQIKQQKPEKITYDLISIILSMINYTVLFYI